MKKLIILGLSFLSLFLLSACNGEEETAEEQTGETTDSQTIACKDEPEGAPVITSLSTNSGGIGSTLEINGCNFSGFEGDLNAWIENSQGVKGILYGQSGSTSKKIKVVLNSPVCEEDTSYSGKACSQWLTLDPGTYKIFTDPWGKESNKMEFTVQ